MRVIRKYLLLPKLRICRLNDGQLLVSFIIPTLNEGSNIASTISSIRASLLGVHHEIIVVDNGSEDDTVQISESLADKTFINPDATIGGLRNIGAAESSGSILVFNDADVRLTEAWRGEFDLLKSSLAFEKSIIGGSLDSPEIDNLLFRSWFKPMLLKKSSAEVSYVGTGHMLVSRDLFFECGGFDEKLVSGEDSDFCHRALRSYAKVFFNPNLKAIHLGYPLSLKAFFIREIWHGKGDFHSLSAFFKSKVAIFSFAMLLSHIALFVMILLQNTEYMIVMSFVVLAFPLSYSILKYPSRLGFRNRLGNFFYAYSYLLARSLSWSSRLTVGS